MSASDSRIGELYEAALKRPPGERASYVTRMAGSDTELRQRVEALLAGQQDTVLPGYEPGNNQAGPLISAGTRISNYRIEGPLGAGGMGVVYFATDTKLNRPAAIKVLPENLADPGARRRFQREAQMVSSLNHPHIVTVYDAGEYQDRQYLITEYVDGGTLRQRATHPHGWRATVELLVGVADAIAAAHEAGILHRDIKPENILLAKNGYAKLADFGVAKLLEVDPLADDPLAGVRGGQHSTRLGTVAYMSPEQLQGLALDARSDVYAFGLVLYELLSGKRPFEEREPGALPDSGTLVPLGAELPAELRTIVAKALEPEPADRYQSMRELVVDLRRLARGSGIDVNRATTAESIGAPPPAPAPRRRGWTRPLGYLLATLAALAVGILARDYARNEFATAPSRNAIAVLPFANESANPDDVSITERVSDKLRERLQELPGLNVVGRVSSVSFGGERIDMRTIASTLGVGLLINGSVNRQGKALDVHVEILDERGFTVRTLSYQRAENELLLLQQEIATEVGAYLVPGSAAGATKPATAPTQQSISANQLLAVGNRLWHQVTDELSVDEQKAQKAIDLYRQATLADPSSIEAHSRLAAALLYLNDVQGAAAPLSRAIELGESLGSDAKSTDLSDAYYTSALYLLATASGGEEKEYKHAIALNASNVDALAAYAQWLFTHNHATEADGYFREAIRLDPQSLSRYVDYAEYLGTAELMEPLRTLGREIQQRFPNARGYVKLARLYELTGDLDIGIAWGLKAYQQLQQSTNATKQPQLEEDARDQVAELYAKIGASEEARQYEPKPSIFQVFLERDYEALADIAGDAMLERPSDFNVQYFYAFALNATGDYANALRILKGLGLPTPPGLGVGGGNRGQANTAYGDALQAVGGNEARVKQLAREETDDLELADRNSLDRSWWVHTMLACYHSQLGEFPAALDSLDRVRNAQGLPSYPLLRDSPCFSTRLGREERYQSLIKRLEDRQKELRERLPATLRAYGVADVRP